MKKALHFLLVSMILFSCNRGHETASGITATSKPEQKAVIKKIINPDQSTHLTFDSLIGYFGKEKKELSFKFKADTTKFFLSSIMVYDAKKVIQVIRANRNISEFEFKLVDWNFDGYPDITVLDNCVSGGCTYWIWNYSPVQEKFVYNKELSERMGLELDTLGKFIIFHYREGAAQEIWDSMQYVNHKLSFIKGLKLERRSDNSGKSWVKRTSARRINNKMVIKLDSVVESANQSHSIQQK